jgi:hypothetical protein
VGAAYVRNRPAADGDQMLGGDVPDQFIVRAHKVRFASREIAIYEDAGYVGLPDAAQGSRRPMRGRDDQSVHSSGNELIDHLRFNILIFFRGRDHEAVRILSENPG